MIDRLLAEPERFDFFQAVRILERIASRRVAERRSNAGTVGTDARPDREPIRFRSLASTRFAASEIASTQEHRGEDGTSTIEMIVAFAGLTGPMGALPDHYTTMLLERLRSRDDTLLEFLDLFNHRLISLYYRAWKKHRFPVVFEQRSAAGRSSDPFTDDLRCLVGLGNAEKRRRLDVPDFEVVYYAGLFGRRVRSVVGLRRLLEEVLRTPVSVQQFRPQWMRLERPNRTRLPRRDVHVDGFNRLGRDATIGERILDVQGGFRIRIGPVGYRTFEGYLPDGPLLHRVCSLARLYVGTEFDFDVQPLLRPDEVPECCLGGSGSTSRLGWNTWLAGGDAKSPREDAVFSLE